LQAGFAGSDFLAGLSKSGAGPAHRPGATNALLRIAWGAAAKKGMSPMHYALLFNETKAERAKRDDPAGAGAYWGAWSAYIDSIAQSGVMISGNGLQPPEVSTTLRVENGTRHVVDGPFADTKEALGGFVVIDVPDLSAALEWASRAPCASAGSVEIRPVLPPPPGR
jgi:hypothetical protein